MQTPTRRLVISHNICTAPNPAAAYAALLKHVSLYGHDSEVPLTILRRETFENIYLDLSKESGRCKLAESGLGWKPSGGTDPFTLESSQIGSAQWSRAAKGYELKIFTRDAAVIQLDGFEEEVSLPSNHSISTMSG